MKKIAFTMAEVLITLGIIGVVAAMTLPTLVNKYKEQETVIRVKKFYSVFSQAYTMAILQNGTLDTWGLQDSESVIDDNGLSLHAEESLKEYDKFFKIMKPYLKKITYKPLKNAKLGDPSYGYGYVLADGTAIVGLWLTPSKCAENPKAACGDFYISTDGKGLYEYPSLKVRNRVFAFILYKDRIFPYGTGDASFKEYCLKGNNYSRCSGWVIANGNMDYLHCSDLSFTSKTKCKQ